MHEMSIAREIIEIVRREISARNLTGVEQIGVKLGALSGVNPDALSFCFDAATMDMPALKAELIIESVPVKGKCLSCGGDIQIDDFIFICPLCDSPDIEIFQGEELQVDYIVPQDNGC